MTTKEDNFLLNSDTKGKNSVPSIAKGESKKRSKKRLETYSIYIYKLLKQIHPDTGGVVQGNGIMNSFVKDIFECIATDTAKLAAYSNTKTLTSHEIQTSVRLIHPGELAKHPVSEGTKVSPNIPLLLNCNK
eukprot:IDg9701t1